MKSQPIVKKTIQRIESEIDEVASQKELNDSDESTETGQLENLKEIAATLEEIDHSVDSLLEKQSKKAQ